MKTIKIIFREIHIKRIEHTIKAYRILENKIAKKDNTTSILEQMLTIVENTGLLARVQPIFREPRLG